MPGQDRPNCIQSLIADYKLARGVCPGSGNFGEYPESVTTCDRNGAPGKALCSEATESLLLEKECKDYVWNTKQEVWQTIRWGLIDSMCTHVIKRYLLVLVAINILGIISVTEGS